MNEEDNKDIQGHTDNNNIYQREEVASTFYEDSCHIIEEARTSAFRAINTA